MLGLITSLLWRGDSDVGLSSRMPGNGRLRSFHMLGPAALETEWSMNSSVPLPAESFHLWELVVILVVVEKVALVVGELLVG